QIGRELHALEIGAYAFRERLRERRLSRAGIVLEQDVAAAEKSREHLLHDLRLAGHDALDAGKDESRELARLDGQRSPRIVHASLPGNGVRKTVSRARLSAFPCRTAASARAPPASHPCTRGRNSTGRAFSSVPSRRCAPGGRGWSPGRP